MTAKYKRRDIMKVAGSSVGTSTLTGVVSASSKTIVSGITYDTLTHQNGPNASGSVSKSSNGVLQGKLIVGGYNLLLEEVEQVQSLESRNRYVGFFTDQRFTTDDTPLKLDFFDHGDQLSGHLTRPGREYGKLGFMLFEDQDRRSSRAREAITPDKRWENSKHSFEVPENGVPTDSGIGRLMEILDENSEEDE